MTRKGAFLAAISSLVEMGAIDALNYCLEEAHTLRHECPACHADAMFFDALFASPYHIVCIIDIDGVILEVNATLAARFGQKPAEIIGQDVFDYFPEATAERRRLVMEAVIESGQVVRFQDMTSIGVPGMPLETYVYPLFGSHGQVDRLAIVSCAMRMFWSLESAQGEWRRV